MEDLAFVSLPMWIEEGRNKKIGEMRIILDLLQSRQYLSKGKKLNQV